MPSALEITALPALADNYIWLLRSPDQDAVVVIDPGDARPVNTWLLRHRYRLDAILLTHHHADHVAGVPELRARWGVPVYAPALEPSHATDYRVGDNENITVLNGRVHFQSHHVPGHTRGAIAWFGAGLLCSGDTLFSAGCGRVLGGTVTQLFASLQRLAMLPSETQLLCGHEYTETNLRFAASIEPDNEAIAHALVLARQQRANNLPTLPTTLGHERAVNPFLRCDQANIHAAAEGLVGHALHSAVDVFRVLRECKDHFR